MSYSTDNRNPNRAQRVALLVFRQARNKDHELLVGRSLAHVSEAFRLPLRGVEHEEGQPPQPEAHAARCASEVIFHIPLTKEDADMRRTVGFSDETGTDRTRGFPVRTTPAFDAAARDGQTRLGHVYEFVRLSELTAQGQSIIPDMTFPNSAVKDFLDDYIMNIEPAMNTVLAIERAMQY